VLQVYRWCYNKHPSYTYFNCASHTQPSRRTFWLKLQAPFLRCWAPRHVVCLPLPFLATHLEFTCGRTTKLNFAGFVFSHNAGKQWCVSISVERAGDAPVTVEHADYQKKRAQRAAAAECIQLLGSGTATPPFNYKVSNKQQKLCTMQLWRITQARQILTQSKHLNYQRPFSQSCFFIACPPAFANLVNSHAMCSQKGSLQELLSRKGLMPEYVTQKTGPPHASLFQTKVRRLRWRHFKIKTKHIPLSLSTPSNI